ncbi:MAG: helix-turn-helix transcriptional regulator [Oscillospiraceae bacterium]|nr:helix-turn-helix transcriptional regulator [Oscillospiraceae bacterium]MBO7727000.1 helix-turn-helix transcriptional regulator [Oscillospiraceae bacterium]MBP5281064.1 helix-turn-helix transcriptional regulator [Lachnospiraceae bacterium]
MNRLAIGRNIRKALDKRKLSQVWLAKQIGVSNTLFTPWMSGKCLPSLMMLYRISRVLEVSMDQLMEGIDDDDF